MFGIFLRTQVKAPILDVHGYNNLTNVGTSSTNLSKL